MIPTLEWLSVNAETDDASLILGMFLFPCNPLSDGEGMLLVVFRDYRIVAMPLIGALKKLLAQIILYNLIRVNMFPHLSFLLYGKGLLFSRSGVLEHFLVS